MRIRRTCVLILPILTLGVWMTQVYVNYRQKELVQQQINISEQQKNFASQQIAMMKRQVNIAAELISIATGPYNQLQHRGQYRWTEAETRIGRS
jgi:hypothetical protein